MLAAALKLAQTSVFNHHSKQQCIFLIDDLPAELERRNREEILSALMELDVQIFVTAIDAGGIDTSAWPGLKLFHVERGHIREMI
jgi:DNA replication and repair protein RecF